MSKVKPLSVYLPEVPSIKNALSSVRAETLVEPLLGAKRQTGLAIARRDS